MIAKIRLIIFAVAALLYAAVFAFGGYYFYKSGENGAVIKQLKKDNKAITTIKGKVEVRYVEVEKIKQVIKLVPDRSGCLDAPIISPVITNKLHKAYSASS